MWSLSCGWYLCSWAVDLAVTHPKIHYYTLPTKSKYTFLKTIEKKTYKSTCSSRSAQWLLVPWALSYYSDRTLSQGFQLMAAQLSMKAALPLAKILVTASCRSSKTGPSLLTLHRQFITSITIILNVCNIIYIYMMCILYIFPCQRNNLWYVSILRNGVKCSF